MEGIDCENEQANSVTATDEMRHFDAETVRRIEEWLDDSRHSYGKVLDLSCTSENSWRKDSEVGDGLGCTTFAASRHPDKHLLTTEIPFAAFKRKKGMNKNRWKGRIPTDQGESLSASLPSDFKEASPGVRVRLRTLPKPCSPQAAQPPHPTGFATSQLVLIQPQQCRAAALDE